MISSNPGIIRVSSDPVSAMAATSLLPARPAKAFQCDHPGCNRSFEKGALLKRHQKLHSGNCKFVCDVCHKCFESQSKIDDHYRKHTGEKPFSCHVCGNKFRYKGKKKTTKTSSLRQRNLYHAHTHTFVKGNPVLI